MSTKHFHPPTHPSLVLPALRALVLTSPSLTLHAPSKTLLLSPPPPSVPLLCGGGSGHEPFAAGYVAPGLLTGAVSGEVFASPSAAQILTAIRLLASPHPEKGVLILHNNYTGDCLHFGLAAEHAHALGLRTRTVLQADDVSLPRARSAKLGRRGLAGIILTAKILGAASALSLPLDDLATLGDTVVLHTGTIGTGLDRCHLPSQPPETWDPLPGAALELGMGMHNEPGVRRVDAGLSADEMVAEMLALLLSRADPERAYLPPFTPSDRPVLLINNLGGLAPLELNALAALVLARLAAPRYGITPARVYAGTYLTSLNSPAFSVTLMHVDAAQRALPGSFPSILELLDARTDCPAWAGARGAYVPSAVEEVGEEEGER